MLQLKQTINFIDPYYEIRIREDGLITVISHSKRAKGRELSQYKTKDGYLRVKMSNKHKLIHHLVTSIFLGERPKNYTVNHKDGNKLNNHPDNLEYTTIADNIKHAIENNLHITCTPTKLKVYKDGRCKDIVKYKNSWYIKNRDRILNKAKEKYERRKTEA